MKLNEEARRHMKTIVKEVKSITIDIADNGYIINYSGCTEEETYQSSNNFKVYPNPTDSFIWVENIKTSDKTEVEIYDINGKLIHQETIGKKTKINTKKWETGTYVIAIHDIHNLLYTSKFIVK